MMTVSTVRLAKIVTAMLVKMAQLRTAFENERRENTPSNERMSLW